MDQVYGFVGRGLLAQAALDRTQRRKLTPPGSDPETERRLSIDLLDPELIGRARKMASVYVAIAAFENSARDLVARTLAEKKGESWWDSSVSKNTQKRANARREAEQKVRWHTQRGSEPINYCDFGDLADIVTQNWNEFSDLLLDQPWVKNIFGTLERSRNVIMHSGELDPEDVARIGVLIRDWVRQVPA